jgi:hypothetical protein
MTIVIIYKLGRMNKIFYCEDLEKLLMIGIKSDAPMIAVTTPKGISAGNRTRAILSHTIIRIPPNRIDAGTV